MVTTSWTPGLQNSLLSCHYDFKRSNVIPIRISPPEPYPEEVVLWLFVIDGSLNAHPGIFHDVLNVKFVYDVLNVIS